jgi:exonuclease-1
MGIKNLLPLMQDAIVRTSLTTMKGSRIAVDVSGWLHKSIYTFAHEFILNGFRDNQLYVDFIIGRVLKLKEEKIEAILVFDGKRNILKSDEQKKREELRLGYIEHAKQLLINIKESNDEAYKKSLQKEAIEYAQKGLNVTHEMEKNTIKALRKMGCQVIVAPYEADPQLGTYLSIFYLIIYLIYLSILLTMHLLTSSFM